MMTNFLKKIEMLCVMIIFPWLICEGLSYPVFGTKRYGRSTSTPSRRGGLETYMQPPYYPEPIKYPPFATASEYDVEYFYPPEPTYNYPLAASYARRYPISASPNEKYPGGYQTLMPYMYDSRRPGVGYYGMADPVLPIDEGEERGDALPIGQETWFEPQETLADANAAFLQNLILSQMYNDAQYAGDSARRQAENGGVQEGAEDTDIDWAYDTAAGNTGGYFADDYEDEDVKDLKSLVKKTNKNGKNVNGGSYLPTSRRVIEGNTWYEKKKNLESNVWDSYGKRNNEYYGKVVDNPMHRNQHNRWVDLPSELSESFERKAKRVNEEENKDAANSETMTTSETPVSEDGTTEAASSFDVRRGQKEVPLLRPPTRHAVFAELEAEKARSGAGSPSVYETIKQLLTMEQGLKDEVEDVRPGAMKKKRFVSNEETLVDQLGLLKKSAT